MYYGPAGQPSLQLPPEVQACQTEKAQFAQQMFSQGHSDLATRSGAGYILTSAGEQEFARQLPDCVTILQPYTHPTHPSLTQDSSLPSSRSSTPIGPSSPQPQTGLAGMMASLPPWAPYAAVGVVAVGAFLIYRSMSKA